MKTVQEALHHVQKNLNARKDKQNSFGGYAYRNAEGIIAAYKQIAPVGANLTMSDSISVVGERMFLTATARFTFGGESIETTGCAMHAFHKKGMDDAQITGAASSYARKYALGGLFAIDDSEHDPDSKDNSKSGERPVRELSWAETVIQDLPDNATERDKAQAITDALCAQWKRKQTDKQLQAEWDRRQKLMDALEEKHMDLYMSVVDAYEAQMKTVMGQD